MSADGSVELVFAGDLRLFRLGLDNLIALQDKRNAGPLEIAQRLQFGTWRVEDITETIRIGLIGAGLDGKAARDLVAATVRPPEITLHVMTALAIILAALQGVPDDPVGKEAVATAAPEAMGASPPPPTTATAQ